MFDIGFWEILLVGVVALVVVGPERFPGMIKKAGFWLGRFRRIVDTVKTEIKTEVDKADQLQNLLDEQKDILNRSVNVDTSGPAVKPKSAEDRNAEMTDTNIDSESGDKTRKFPDVPRPIETAVMRAEREAAAERSSSSDEVRNVKDRDVNSSSDKNSEKST